MQAVLLCARTSLFASLLYCYYNAELYYRERHSKLQFCLGSTLLYPPPTYLQRHPRRLHSSPPPQVSDIDLFNVAEVVIIAALVSVVCREDKFVILVLLLCQNHEVHVLSQTQCRRIPLQMMISETNDTTAHPRRQERTHPFVAHQQKGTTCAWQNLQHSFICVGKGKALPCTQYLTRYYESVSTRTAFWRFLFVCCHRIPTRSDPPRQRPRSLCSAPSPNAAKTLLTYFNARLRRDFCPLNTRSPPQEPGYCIIGVSHMTL